MLINIGETFAVSDRSHNEPHWQVRSTCEL